MKTKIFSDIAIKEFVVITLVVIVINLLGRWTYFFLPDEYAAKAQFPNIELLLISAIAVVCGFVYRLTRRINEVEKQLKGMNVSKEDID
ncbi:unnamed protein product [marine sediment metagenome]|uniref:Uncharacterized protein n=1 Tax=marine sediment metagenome TaxID=412755 RepID=X1JLT8_9ZZZZ